MPPTPGGPGLRPALCGLSRDATRLPIPPRRGPHRPRTRVAALETMRGPGPACLVGVSALQTVSKTEACAPATLSSLRRELRASRGWSKPEGGGGGRGLHPTPPRSQAEPKLGGSGGLPAAWSPPRGPRRPRDAPSGFARRRRSQPARCAQDHSAPFDLRRAGTAGLGCSPYRANSPGARVRLIPPPSAGRLRGAQESVVRAQQEKSVQRRQTAGRRGEPPCAVWC